MKIQGSNNVNFGWSCETHKQIMRTAIKDMPQFAKYQDLMEDYVQRPDHDDIGFLANKHFYFGEKMHTDTFNREKFDNVDEFYTPTEEPQENNPEQKKIDLSKSALVLGKSMTCGVINAFSKIFNTNAVSFMDYNGKNNAKYAYKEQIEKMDEAIEDEDDELALQNAARACHFLQDVSQPQHIEETSTLGKAVDLKIHTDYEKFAEDHSEELGNQFVKTVRNPRSSMKLFTDTFMATKETGKITRQNEPHWNEITKKQFDIAVQATKEFLQNVSDQMGLEYREICAQEEHHHE